MAKRFTDTGKWDKGSFAELPAYTKLIWLYLCDKCDHAGIWDANFGLMSYQLGEQITRNDILALGDRVEWLSESKLFIPGFVEFQYGELNPDNRAHLSVIKRLQKEGACKGLTSPLEGAKDKDKESSSSSLKKRKEVFDFDQVYARYPRKVGKAEGLSRLRSLIVSQDDYDALNRALDKFIAYHRGQKTEPHFVPYFSSWVGVKDRESWRDWLDPTAGSTAVKATAVRSVAEIDAEYEQAQQEKIKKLRGLNHG